MAGPQGNGNHILSCSFIPPHVGPHRCGRTASCLSQNGNLKSHSVRGGQKERNNSICSPRSQGI